MHKKSVMAEVKLIASQTTGLYAVSRCSNE